MEFIIDKDEFVKGLYRAQSVVERKGTMPILLNVLIEASGGTVSITATDLEIAVRAKHPADIKKEGKSTVSAKKLYEVVKELPDEKVLMRQKENQWVEVSSGKSFFNIMGISAETFPTLPPHQEEEFITVKSQILREMIEKTIFSVSNDESRYNLTGVFLSRKKEAEKELRMVATDGYRLSLIDRPIEEMIGGLEEGILLPKKGLTELNKLLHEEGDEISIKMKQNNCIAKKDNTILVMRLLDAEFPDYRQVIPPKSRRQIKMSRVAILESLRRVSILSSEKTKGVKFHFMKDTLELSSYSPDIGEAKEELTIEYKGEDIIVGFNARFVLDVLNILNSDEILFDLEDGVSPSVIRPAEDLSHTCVVMPMRI